MQIIAERDKKLGKILFFLSIALVPLSIIFILNVSLWHIALLVLSVFLLCFAVYITFLLPKTAIVKDGDTVVIYFAFHQKKIEISTLEYVSYPELGTWYTRRTSFISLHILRNDIRSLTLTVKKEGVLQHHRVNRILNASTVAVTINALIEKTEK